MNRLTGQVINAVTGEPVPFATVYQPGTNNGIVAFENGQFSIDLLPGFPQDVEISSVGYFPVSIINIEDQQGEYILTIEMEPDIADLPEAVIFAEEEPKTGNGILWAALIGLAVVASQK